MDVRHAEGVPDDPRQRRDVAELLHGGEEAATPARAFLEQVVVVGVDGEVLPVTGAVRVDVLEWVGSREHTAQAQGFLQIPCL